MKTQRSRAEARQVLLETLRQARVKAGLRQADIGKHLGKPQSFVSKYESGERRLDILELREICEALGVSLVGLTRRLEQRLG